MNTTLKQQIDAILEAMARRSFTLREMKGRGLTPDEHMADPQWAALNDAASTIAGINLSKKADRDLLKENKELRVRRDTLGDRLNEGRNYLMGVDPNKLNVVDSLNAFGFDSLGYEKIETH